MEKEVETDMLWEQRLCKVYCITAVIEYSYRYHLILCLKKGKRKRFASVYTLSFFQNSSYYSYIIQIIMQYPQYQFNQ